MAKTEILRCHPEDKPKDRAPELALSTTSNYEEICGNVVHMVRRRHMQQTERKPHELQLYGVYT